ncbi:MAG: hypothetical protein E7264_07455 [Lachnospiraceae bacterium]|nr:hypothetical protein [Lachnospiraceae bacterium]
MDFTSRRPFSAIEGYDHYSMLEMLIPFVEPSLKLPLALFIKYNETKLIMHAFQSTENLIRLGLHNPSSDPLDIVCTMTGMSKEMLTTLFAMMDGDQTSMFQNFFQNTPGENSYHTATDTNHFEDNIHDIFARYDAEQENHFAD